MHLANPQNGFTLILGTTHGHGLEIAKICFADSLVGTTEKEKPHGVS